MCNTLNVALAGISGQMNKFLIDLISSNKKINITSSYSRKSSKYIGKKIGNSIVSSKLDDLGKNSEIIIDFTNPQLTVSLAKVAEKNKVPLVVGTTGLSKAQENVLFEKSKIIPIIYCSNTSVGIALLNKLVREVSTYLDNEWDVEIIEKHHNKKIDFPSGTAISLGKSIALGRKVNFKKVFSFNRNSLRKKGQIGFASTRAGNIVGEHEVGFFGDSESLEISHRVTDRKIFAKGAIKAAYFAKNVKKPGLYSMDDVFA